jgi:hypothetical protein
MITRICCAHAGGQGKTTVAQALYVASLKSGVQTSLVAADFIDESGQSKLGHMYPGQVTELGTGPTVAFAKEANDLNANVKYWDRIGPELTRGNTVIDLGANVVDQILQWGNIRNAASLLKSRNAPPIDVFLVCKAEQRAVDDMSDLVRRFGSGESLPVRKIFIVLNEQGGSFDGLGLRSTLSKIKVNTDIEFVHFPRCTSELWHPMEQRYVSVQRALSMEPEAVSEQLGVDFWSVYSGIEDIRKWYNASSAEFKAKGVI